MNLETIYFRSPVFVQNLFTTAFGIRERCLRYGGNYSRYVSELRESETWPLARLEEQQNEKLQKLIRHCYENVPYYSQLFDRLNLKPADIQTTADLAKLPVLEKETVRENPAAFLARNFK